MEGKFFASKHLKSKIAITLIFALLTTLTSNIRANAATPEDVAKSVAADNCSLTPGKNEYNYPDQGEKFIVRGNGNGFLISGDGKAITFSFKEVIANSPVNRRITFNFTPVPVTAVRRDTAIYDAASTTGGIVTAAELPIKLGITHTPSDNGGSVLFYSSGSDTTFKKFIDDIENEIHFSCTPSDTASTTTSSGLTSSGAEIPPPPDVSNWELSIKDGKEVIIFSKGNMEATFRYVTFIEDRNIKGSRILWEFTPTNGTRNIAIQTVRTVRAGYDSTEAAIPYFGWIRKTNETSDVDECKPSTSGDLKGLDGGTHIFCKVDSNNWLDKMTNAFPALPNLGTDSSKYSYRDLVTAMYESIDYARVVANRGNGANPKPNPANLKPEVCGNFGKGLIFPFSHPANVTYSGELLQNKFKVNLEKIFDKSGMSDGLKQEYLAAVNEVITPTANINTFFSNPDEDINYYKMFYNSNYDKSRDNARTIEQLANDPNLRYPNVAITNDLILYAYEPLGEEYKDKLENPGEARAAGWAVIAAAVLGIPVFIAFMGPIIASTPLLIGGAAAFGGTQAYLVSTIGKITNTSTREAKMKDAVKLFVKTYYIGEYIFANYKFNTCLQANRDPYAFVNPSILPALEAALHSVNINDPDPCGCDPKYNTSIFSFWNSIRGALCAFLCDLKIFAQKRLESAIGTLNEAIGIHYKESGEANSTPEWLKAQYKIE